MCEFFWYTAAFLFHTFHFIKGCPFNVFTAFSWGKEKSWVSWKLPYIGFAALCDFARRERLKSLRRHFFEMCALSSRHTAQGLKNAFSNLLESAFLKIVKLNSTENPKGRLFLLKWRNFPKVHCGGTKNQKGRFAVGLVCFLDLETWKFQRENPLIWLALLGSVIAKSEPFRNEIVFLQKKTKLPGKCRLKTAFQAFQNYLFLHFWVLEWGADLACFQRFKFRRQKNEKMNSSNKLKFESSWLCL